MNLGDLKRKILELPDDIDMFKVLMRDPDGGMCRASGISVNLKECEIVIKSPINKYGREH